METHSLSNKYLVPFRVMQGDTPIGIADIEVQDWLRIAQTVHREDGILISLWGTDRKSASDPFIVSVAYCVAEGLLWLRFFVREESGYPDLSGIFPGVVRMQRALFDLLGIPAQGT